MFLKEQLKNSSPPAKRIHYLFQSGGGYGEFSFFSPVSLCHRIALKIRHENFFAPFSTEKNMASMVRGKIVSMFKLHGLSLKTDAAKFLTEVLSSVTEVELEDWLDKIVEGVQKQPLSSSLVDREIVEQAVQECSQTSEDDGDKAFTIIDAFSVPRFTFNVDRKKFLPSSGSVALHSNNPNAKPEVRVHVYHIYLDGRKRIVRGSNASEHSNKFLDSIAELN